MTANPLIVDLYHGDRVTDLAAAKAAGVAGVIHKAHQGASSRGDDPTYAIRRRAARNAGLLWGAYHFMTDDDPDAQAAARRRISARRRDRDAAERIWRA